MAADALDTLFRIDPALVLPLAEGAMANADANVRWQGQRAYVTLPTPERMHVLGTALDDVHPRNRIFVRDELYRLAGQPGFIQVLLTAIWGVGGFLHGWGSSRPTSPVSHSGED